MSRKIFTLFLLITISSAQIRAERIKEQNEVIATVGINVPMYKNIESDVIVGLNYGHYYHNGIGYRAGIQYAPSVADIDNYFGIPLAFTYRLGSLPTEQRVQKGIYGAFDADYWDYSENILANSIMGFLINIFDRLEFHAGITPGYIAGESDTPNLGSSGSYYNETWTERVNKFSLLIDAGIIVNIRIWRFDIKAMPTFHYNITNNYIYHLKEGYRDRILSQKNTPLKWFFKFSGGIAFRF